MPLLLLALILTGVTNWLLQASAFMMTLSLITIVALTLAIGALALGYGTFYPQFETENAAQIPTSFGGLVFMMTTIALLALVIGGLSQIVYPYVRSVYEGHPVVVTPWMIISTVGVALVCVAATAIPLWLSIRKMEQFEF